MSRLSASAMIRRLMFCVLWILLGSEFAPAAGADGPSISSPDKKFTVVFSDRQTFTVQDSRGAAVFASQSVPRFREVAEFRPNHVLWSPDGTILAIPGRGGFDCETLILMRRGNSFAPVSVPQLTDRYDNSFVLPFKWLKGHRLILQISGPHIGKASGYSYEGRATIGITLEPPACEVLYKRITEHYERNGF